MTTATLTPPTFETLADVIAAAGGVPPEQVIYNPSPGTATEADAEACDRAGNSYELVSGILLRKVMGTEEDIIGSYLCHLLWQYVEDNDLGVIGSSQAMLRLAPGLVRMPDACFTPWELRDQATPGAVFQDVLPTLVVEVLSASNRKGDMAAKLAEYAAAGIELVWYIDPVRQEIDIYPRGQIDLKTTLTVSDTLTGGDVLSGFTLPVERIFKKVEPRKPRKKA